MASRFASVTSYAKYKLLSSYRVNTVTRLSLRDELEKVTLPACFQDFSVRFPSMVSEMGVFKEVILREVLIVKLQLVVFDIPPPVPVTVIGYVPVKAESDVLKVKVVEKLGEPEVGENEAVTPEGNPEILCDTGLEVPERREVVIAVEFDEPLITDT